MAGTAVEQFAAERPELQVELGFDVSIGLGLLKSVAKLASRAAKPERGGRGVVSAITADEVDALLSQTDLAVLPADGQRSCCSAGVVAAVAATVLHGSAPSLRDAQELSLTRLEALLRSEEGPTGPGRSSPGSLARELYQRVRGEAVDDDDARVQERRPQNEISQSLSLAVVPIVVPVRGRTTPVSPLAAGDSDESRGRSCDRWARG